MVAQEPLGGLVFHCFIVKKTLIGRCNLHTNGKLTHCLRSTGAPQPDGALNNASRIKNNHYRQKYAELPEPIVFMPVAGSTSHLGLDAPAWLAGEVNDGGVAYYLPSPATWSD